MTEPRSPTDSLLAELADDLDDAARELEAELETKANEERELMTETKIERADGRTATARDFADLRPAELREMRARYAAEIERRQRQLDRLVEGRLDDREIMSLRSEISANRGAAVGDAEELRRDLHYSIESMRKTVRLADRRLGASDHRQRRAELGAARSRLSAESVEISREIGRLEALRGSLAFDVVALGQKTDREDELATVEADLAALTLRSERFSAALAELDRGDVR